MISIPQSKLDRIHNELNSVLLKQKAAALERLLDIDGAVYNSQEVQYLTNVIELFNRVDVNIISMQPALILKVVNSIGEIPASSLNEKKQSLKFKILKALNYKSLRNSFYPKYFFDIGIKACVYCNSQLALSVKIKNQKVSSKFEIDHYYAKDKYPFLSISLFNLYPACSSCNRLKGVRKVEFNLYSPLVADCSVSKYKFILESSSISKYLTNHERSSIEFKFKEPNYASPDAETFNDVFQIEAIYNEQKDIVEELIIKSQIYNPSYIDSLKSNFISLGLKPELFRRLIIGNYTEEKDMHKRPMSKFVMDIARDLNLID